jgi:Ca2+-binding EF-hand superfamily protein
MKLSKLATAAAIGAAIAFSPVVSTYAQQDSKMMQELKKMDVNKDGMVSREEFLRMMGAKFDAMDKDKKGMLSLGDISKIIYSFNP